MSCQTAVSGDTSKAGPCVIYSDSESLVCSGRVYSRTSLNFSDAFALASLRPKLSFC